LQNQNILQSTKKVLKPLSSLNFYTFKNLVFFILQQTITLLENFLKQNLSNSQIKNFTQIFFCEKKKLPNLQLKFPQNNLRRLFDFKEQKNPYKTLFQQS